MHKNRVNGCRGPPVEAPGHVCLPGGNPACAAFEEYEEVPETVPLDFTEDDVTWIASKLSGAEGALGAEAIELQNWLLCFGCVSEELRSQLRSSIASAPSAPAAPESFDAIHVTSSSVKSRGTF